MERRQLITDLHSHHLTPAPALEGGVEEVCKLSPHWPLAEAGLLLSLANIWTGAALSR